MKFTVMSTEELNSCSNTRMTLKDESVNRGPFPGSRENLQHL